jgi:hypothetical protein
VYRVGHAQMLRARNVQKPDTQSSEQSSEGDKEDDDNAQPLLAMKQADELADEFAIPYEIVSQGRTNKTLGNRVKYKIRWIINDEPGPDASCTWEMAHELKDDPDFKSLIE